MRTLRQLAFLIFAMALLVPVHFMGCDDTGTNGGDDDTTTDTTIDTAGCDAALALIADANDSLGRQLFELIDVTLDDPDTSFRPDEVDFTGLNQLYSSALELCPSNRDAKFGVAFTSLMLFLVDPD